MNIFRAGTTGRARNLVFSLLAALPTALTALPAAAGEVEVHHAWIRAVPAVARNSAAYMMLVSNAEQADRLLGARTDIAETVEIHKVVKNGNMMEMLRSGPVTIESGGHFELKQGGYHLMLINLTRVPNEGESVKLVLTFEKAGEVVTEALVRRSSGMSQHNSHSTPDHNMNHQQMKHEH